MGWSDIFTRKSETWIFCEIEEPSKPAKEIVTDAAYISIKLRSLRIGYVRKVFDYYYGAIHSNVSILHKKEKIAQFNVVTKPGNLEKLDSKRLYNVISIDTKLLEYVPYRGGSLDLELGLFSIKAQDLASPFISLLSEMSKLGGVSFVGTALPYATPILKGINYLAGNDETILEIGLTKSFEPVKTGCYAVIKAEKGKLNPTGFKMGKDSRLEDANGNDFEQYPYFVFEISSSQARPDWFNIPDISKAFSDFQDKANAGKKKEAEDALSVLRRTMLFSADLLRVDAEKLYAQIEKDMETAYPSTRSRNAAINIRTIKNLSDYTL